MRVNKLVTFKSFHPFVQFQVDFDTKAKYNRALGHIYDYFMNEVDQNQEMFSRYNSWILENKKNKIKYVKKLRRVSSYASKEYIEKQIGCSARKYSEVERQLIKDIKPSPQLDVRIDLILSYTSPKGRSHYSHLESYSISDYHRALEDLNKKLKYFQTRDYQRSLMTADLRYRIMKRDGFRCVLCGRSADDGVKLHVDHIKPVSKGGKTEMSNLRTLCEDCNLGKSAKYDPTGLN